MNVVQIDFYKEDAKREFDSLRDVMTEEQAILRIQHEEKHDCSYGIMIFEDGSRKGWDNETYSTYECH